MCISQSFSFVDYAITTSVQQVVLLFGHCFEPSAADTPLFHVGICTNLDNYACVSGYL